MVTQQTTRWSEKTLALIGNEALTMMNQKKIILFGIGGVGGWCAEILIRAGIQNLSIVDFDVVQETNLNRQIIALQTNIGQPKVDVLQKRLLAINPNARVETFFQRFSPSTSPSFKLNEYDYVLDAIDDVPNKILLINLATHCKNTLFFSSMGAARRTDPTKVSIGNFSKVTTCPLAKTLRNNLKKNNFVPGYDFQCVFSTEQAKKTNGTLVSVVATFGIHLAHLVLQDILSHTK